MNVPFGRLLPRPPCPAGRRYRLQVSGEGRPGSPGDMTSTEGIPDYADDTSTAYDSGDRPGFEDSPPALAADEPQGVDEFGVTPAEQRAGEPLAARLVREEPDVPPVGDEPVGRLVATDEGAHEDEEGQAIAYDTGEHDGLTAEEQAVHEVPDR